MKKKQSFSFCETATAGPKSPWHIRPLTAKGRNFGGGADTPALCERVVAWDLDVEICDYHLTHCCQECARRFREKPRPANVKHTEGAEDGIAASPQDAQGELFDPEKVERYNFLPGIGASAAKNGVIGKFSDFAKLKTQRDEAIERNCFLEKENAILKKAQSDEK